MVLAWWAGGYPLRPWQGGRIVCSDWSHVTRVAVWGWAGWWRAWDDAGVCSVWSETRGVAEWVLEKTTTCEISQLTRCVLEKDGFLQDPSHEHAVCCTLEPCTHARTRQPSLRLGGFLVRIAHETDYFICTFGLRATR
jgi:hypothetical protein